MAKEIVIGQSGPPPISVIVGRKRYPVRLSAKLAQSIASSGLTVENIAARIQEHVAGGGTPRPQKSTHRTGIVRFGGHRSRPKQSVTVDAPSGERFFARYTISLISLPSHKSLLLGTPERRLKARVFILELSPTFSGEKLAPPASVVEQYRANVFKALRKSEEAEHRTYLDRVTALGESPVPDAVALRGLDLWRSCVSRSPKGIFLPVAGATDSGHLIYTWDAKGIHLEAELADGRLTEWYYQNDKKNDIWYENTDEVPVLAGAAIREIAEASTR